MKLQQGDVAVVTGAASGIGLALTHELLSRGANVVLADVELPALTSARKDLDETRTLAVPTDVTDPAQLDALAQATITRFGKVDLLVANAGVGGGAGPLWELDERDWRWTIDVNLLGVVHALRSFVPLLIANGRGHVLNVASAAGLTSPPFLAPYAATKHAVVGLTDTLAADLALLGAPVGTTVACPGFVDTGIHTSERNRPAHLRHDQQRHPAAARFEQAFAAMVAEQQIPAAQAAALLLDAVEEGRRFVLTDRAASDDVHRRQALIEVALLTAPGE